MSSQSLSDLSPEINYNKLIFPIDSYQSGGVLSAEDESKSTAICCAAIILICIGSICLNKSSSNQSKTLKISGYTLIAIAVLLLLVMCMCYCNCTPSSDWTI